MKSPVKLLLTALGVAASMVAGQTQILVPSDGSDGVLDVTESIVIDLSQAPTGRWDANNSANAGKGIYDPEKWAVVFKYSAVNIASGATVRFQNNATRAPVVWLVQGHVVINGTVNLSGQDGVPGVAGLALTEPGPGGARGGAFGPQGYGSGLGPGGGDRANYSGNYSTAYGNPRILPLIGGSGGGGFSIYDGTSGGAGGGAILIGAGGSVRIDGAVLAKGGFSTSGGSGGSGGAVRIIGAEIAGAGEINCLPSKSGLPRSSEGRIRLEALSVVSGVRTAPETVIVKAENPPIIWVPDNAPKVRIVSVDAVDAPADPTAPLRTSADIAIQNDNPVSIVLETPNFPLESDVSVRIAEKWGPATWVKAGYVSGDQSRAIWQVTTKLVKGYTTLQARITAP